MTDVEITVETDEITETEDEAVFVDTGKEVLLEAGAVVGAIAVLGINEVVGAKLLEVVVIAWS